jgi:hypothetical protein
MAPPIQEIAMKAILFFLCVTVTAAVVLGSQAVGHLTNRA